METLWDDWKSQHLRKEFEPIDDPMEFYNDIFSDGFLQAEGEDNYYDGKPNGIAVELVPNPSDPKKPIAKRYTVCDGLDTIDYLLTSNNFVIISPISYIGKARSSKNARYIHALTVDVDGMQEDKHMRDLIYQMDGFSKLPSVPRPTYIVNSGNGLHYYYVLEKPIPVFENTAKEMQIYKDRLTRIIWNKYVTTLHDKVQIESLFQGFRLAGGISKDNKRTVIFRSGEKVGIEYLNGFVSEKYQIKHATYYKNLPLSVAQTKYPEWYQRRVVDKQPKGHWQTKKDLYDWWLRRIKNEKTVGHRYFCIMCLAVYAKKAGVDYGTLYDDAMDLIDDFDALTTEESNHFTAEDVLTALEMYNDSYYTFPVDTISRISGMSIAKNKRNGRKQSVHLRGARAIRDINDEANGTNWRDGNGRKPKKDIVQNWRQNHPDGTKYQCIKATGLDKKTVYKWWDAAAHIVVDQDIAQWDDDMRPVPRKLSDADKQKMADVQSGFATTHDKLAAKYGDIEAELEVTRRRMAELQAQLDALKKQQDKKK